MAIISYDTGSDGIVVLTIDDPDNAVNMMTPAFIGALERTIDRLEAERDQIAGVIMTSGKQTFFAGADLDLIVSAGPQDREELAAGARRIESLLRRLEVLERPVVAAINGTALGGGLEIALACHHRIAIDEPKARYGLPESMLGVLPGAGGVVRSVRLLGIAPALSGVLLAQQPARAAKAKELGVIDELVADPRELMGAARAWIASNPEARQPWDRDGYQVPGGAPGDPGAMNVLPAVMPMLRKQLKGARVDAAERIAAVAVESTQVDIDTAFEIEGRAFVQLVCCSKQAKNMIQAFFYDLQHVKTARPPGSRPAGPPAWKATKVAVLGGGMMGSGIANACARAGLPVVLKEVDPEAAERARRRAAGGREDLLERITATVDPADLAGCDLVIEAVFENLQLKHEVLAEAEAHAAPDALIASNTSSLPIADLAKGVKRPEDLIGLHFFSPVEKMPLVEVIRSAHCSETTVARGIDAVRQIRKMPILAADSRGFFTTRVIATYMEEALAMIEEGVHANVIDRTATAACYAVGPIQLIDELDLRLAQKVRGEYRAATERSGGRWEATPAERVTDAMVALDRPGRAAGAGFFEYDQPGGKRAGAWKGVSDAVAAGRAIELPAADIADRLMFIEALETARCFEEGVIASHADANIGSILGIGFPRTTGGVAQFIDQYDGGVAGFVARADELADAYGERFRPTDRLRELAAAGEPFRADRKAVAAV
jgi:3-hydroxyacyl-CoA dehydrogenase/enoyl-CoA hydratase/3-hydroxybutyryl-CoA epimerase